MEKADNNIDRGVKYFYYCLQKFKVDSDESQLYFKCRN